MNLYNQAFAPQIASRASQTMPKKVAEWWHGERLRDLRKARDWSQGYVAKKLQVTIQAISNWERNQESPSLERITDFHNLFGASVDFLLGFVDLPYKTVEEATLPPDERRLLEVYRAGKLPALLGEILLAQVENGESNHPQIENKTGREPGDDKALNS